MGGGRGRRGGHGSRRLSPHPAFLATAPSSPGTPRQGTLPPLQHQNLPGSRIALGVVPWGCHPKKGKEASWSDAAQCPQRCAWLLKGDRIVPSVASVPSPHAQLLFITGDLISSEWGCPQDLILSG